ncbi:MAG: SpoIVB peptidase S55 domain-containing protein, partial [Armatimonadota bacterium]
MRPLYYTRLLLGAFFSVFSLGTASSAAVIPSDYSSRILPVSQVKAGMRGYGLTVFQGDKIDKFDVKVEGILPSVNSGRPLILIRVGGGQLNRRAINIAEGMSGSPVYIGGKLIGAVAYAGNFAVEPLGLVTPIEDMLEAWSTTLQAMPPGTGEVQPLPQPVKIGAKSMTSIGIASSPDQKAPSNDPSLGWFRPMATPLMASGLSPKTLAQAADKLSMFPISVRSGPGRMADKSVVFKEGSAVGFSLTTGDIEMTAVGTVTFVDKGRILAFGHPFLAMGPVQMPMSTVWVHDVFPSYEVSYKMASPVRVVGTSVQDRPFGVSGEVGRQSQMVPIAINLRDAASNTSHTFHVNVLNHPLLTPVLTRLAASEALQRFRPYPGEAMARVTMTATAKDVGTVQRTNLFFSPTDVTAEALDDVGNLLNLLQDNKFRPVPLTKLTVDVQIFQTRQTLDIERVAIDKTTYEPGQTVNITVQMRPYKSNPIVKTLQVKIPKDALDGRASVIVQGGGTVADTPGMPSSPGMPVMARPGIPEEIRDAGSLEQMLQRFSQLNRNDQLVARIQLPSASFSIEGGKLIGL